MTRRRNRRRKTRGEARRRRAKRGKMSLARRRRRAKGGKRSRTARGSRATAATAAAAPPCCRRLSRSPAGAMRCPRLCRSRIFSRRNGYRALCGRRAARSGSSARCCSRLASTTAMQPPTQFFDERQSARSRRSVAPAEKDSRHDSTATRDTLAIIHATVEISTPPWRSRSRLRACPPRRCNADLSQPWPDNSAKRAWKPWMSSSCTTTKL